MIGYVESGYWLSFFLLIFGLIFLYASNAPQLRVGNEARGRRFWNKFYKSLFLLFGAFYLFWAFLNLYVTYGGTLYLVDDAPCENLLMNQTVSGNLTTYSYANSCVQDAPPKTVENMFVVFTYVFGLNLVFLLFGSFIWGLWWLFRW